MMLPAGQWRRATELSCSVIKAKQYPCWGRLTLSEPSLAHIQLLYALDAMPLAKCSTSNIRPTTSTMWMKALVTWSAKNPSFMDYDLGYIDLEEKTLQPALGGDDWQAVRSSVPVHTATWVCVLWPTSRPSLWLRPRSLAGAIPETACRLVSNGPGCCL